MSKTPQTKIAKRPSSSGKNQASGAQVEV